MLSFPRWLSAVYVALLRATPEEHHADLKAQLDWPIDPEDWGTSAEAQQGAAALMAMVGGEG